VSADDEARSGVEAHSHATNAAFPQVALELSGLLGPQLVAFLGGVSETRAVHQWASGDRLPSEKVQWRLRFVLRITLQIADGSSASTAQAWFQSLNPHLDDRSPARLLRDGNLDEVGPAIGVAARAFLVAI
jgi:hypothetical protein